MTSPSLRSVRPVTPDRLEQARLRHESAKRTFAQAILNARADAALAAWTPLIARAQRESAPCIAAVRQLALRFASNGPGLSTENSNPNPNVSSNVNTNGHESANGDSATRRRGDSVTGASAPGDPPRSKGPRIGRGQATDASQVRGVLAERVIVSVPLDPFLSLKALAAHAGVSVRTLRAHLGDPAHPLPHYRVGGKIVVRASEYAAWALRYRRVGAEDVDRVVAEVLRELR